MNNLRPVTTITPFSAQAITQNTNTTSAAIDLRALSGNGVFSAFVTMAGTGSIKLEYLLSDSESGTYTTPSSALDIVTAHTSGTDIYSFEPELGPYLKIKATETNVGTCTALTVTIAMQ